MSKISTIAEVRRALAKKSVLVDCGGLKVRLNKPKWDKCLTLLDKMPSKEEEDKISLFKFSLETVRLCLDPDLQELSQDDIADLILSNGVGGGDVINEANRLCGFALTVDDENPTT